MKVKKSNIEGGVIDWSTASVRLITSKSLGSPSSVQSSSGYSSKEVRQEGGSDREGSGVLHWTVV